MPAPTHQTHLPDDLENSEDEGMSDDENISLHQAGGSKKSHKREARIKEFANSEQIQEVSHLGQIPDGPGMVHVDGCQE